MARQTHSKTSERERQKADTLAQGQAQRGLLAGLHADVLALQHAVGNGATSQLLQQRPGSVPSIVEDVVNSGGGRPLDPATQEFMESRFGHDFNNVRLHTCSRAAESAKAIGALAYTVGRHIVFGQGHFAPTTIQGKRLLAHELTHFVQQKGTSEIATSMAGLSEFTEAAELEAATAARAVMHGKNVPPIMVTGSGIQRDNGQTRRGSNPDVSDDVMKLTLESYVDGYEYAIYGIGYRVQHGESSSWIQLNYADGTSIDINLEDIGDETGRESQALDVIINHSHIGEGNRIFPERMNFATTPRLWAAKKAVLNILDNYNTLWILGTFPTWWSLMPVGPIQFGERPTMRIRSIPMREVEQTVRTTSRTPKDEVGPWTVTPPSESGSSSSTAIPRTESTSATPRPRAGATSSTEASQRDIYKGTGTSSKASSRSDKVSNREPSRPGAASSTASQAKAPVAIGPQGEEIPPTSFEGGYCAPHPEEKLTMEMIIRNGLPARGNDMRLLQHAEPGSEWPPSTGSAYRGTTRTPSGIPGGQSGAADWAGESGLVVQVEGVPTWALETALQGRIRLPNNRFRGPHMRGEGEGSILAQVPTENIVRIGRVTLNTRGLAIVKEVDWVANPNYKPRK